MSGDLKQLKEAIKMGVDAMIKKDKEKMSNESMTNQITDAPSAIAELLETNKQLKKQLEACQKQLSALSDIDINENINEGMIWVTEKWFDKAEKFEEQLAEVVEVIEFYGKIPEYYESDDFDTYCPKGKSLSGVKHRYGKRARQFLAKYRGENGS